MKLMLIVFGLGLGNVACNVYNESLLVPCESADDCSADEYCDTDAGLCVSCSAPDAGADCSAP